MHPQCKPLQTLCSWSGHGPGRTSITVYVVTLRPTYNVTPTITYLLTAWSRVLLEKLTGFQLLKQFPAFYGTRRFITAFTSARHWSLS